MSDHLGMDLGLNCVETSSVIIKEENIGHSFQRVCIPHQVIIESDSSNAHGLHWHVSLSDSCREDISITT